LAALLIFVPVHAEAEAASEVAYNLTESDAARGLTIRSSDETLRVGFPAAALDGPARASLTSDESLPVPLSPRYRPVSPAWTIAVDGTVRIGTVPVRLSVVNPSLYRKLLLARTPGGTGWMRVSDSRWDGEAFAAVTPMLPTTLLAVDDTEALEGVASWYASKRYPAGAASNDFPLGTRLKVTNLASGRSTVVTVVSSGPFVPGRVVDLTHKAFAAIAPRGAGVAQVRVERLKPAPPAPVLPDEDAGGTPVADGTVGPEVRAASAAVVDQGTETVLFAKAPEAVRPIASITKLVAVAVFLDTKPDLNRTVAYRASDGAIGGRLRLAPGEGVRLKDYLGAALVGSANNAVKTLARSTGLPPATFVARMNAKVDAWALTSLRFTDPTGLDPGNVGTATDAAKLAGRVFADYPLIRDYTLRSRYTFRTVDRSILHTIKATNTLLTTSKLSLTGGKTGYLDEALYTVVLRARDREGHQVVAAVLGASSSAVRFAEAEALLSWTLAHHVWQS
jgi:D-alanyl-D-alanine endopeptidase (penicillin-binding protein 7)